MRKKHKPAKLSEYEIDVYMTACLIRANYKFDRAINRLLNKPDLPLIYSHLAQVNNTPQALKHQTR